MQLSLAEENYLKAIYFISGVQRNLVNTNAIAERLDTKAATVTDMMRKLKLKGLVHYEPYKGTRLSDDGESIAVAVLRKHRLWETFLVEKLAFGWEEVHEIAEQLEHVRSPKLTERLSKFLGDPQFDPHGDPIPNKDGVFPVREDLTLDKAEAGEKVLVCGVKDSSSEFLSYVGRLGIKLGDELEVLAVESFDHSLQVVHDTQELQLSAIASANIYISRL